jgi:carbamoyl-phosphate synthase large subunit
MIASHIDVPTVGHLLATVADADKEESLAIIKGFAQIGFQIYATEGTAKFLNARGVAAAPVKKIKEGSPNPVDLVRGGQVDLLINTLSRDKQIELEAAQIRRASVELGIPCLTSLDTARALLLALCSRREGLQAMTISEYVAA